VAEQIAFDGIVKEIFQGAAQVGALQPGFGKLID
jgi:hypothetical protein